MNFLQNLFIINHDIIFFIYGLMFFVVGLAIALQTRYSSRLDLARALTWLAAFGFLHGFHEWGDLFIPIQAEYLSSDFIIVLHHVHLLLLAASFACLFQYGIALLEPFAPKWPQFLPAGIFAAWLVFALLPLKLWRGDFESWRTTADALSRYFIGLPGGLLAAYALRKHTLQRIIPFTTPKIVRAIQASGIALGLYAITAGLVVPPVDFFPGNVINTASFTRHLLVPPQLVRALIGLIMAWTTIRMLEIFDMETSRQIETMQEEQLLATERERLARELHDGTIQKVYTAGLLVRSAQNLVEAETPLAGRLSTAVGVLDDAIGDLRGSLNSLKQPAAESGSFDASLRHLLTDQRFTNLVKISLDLDLPETDVLAPERAGHILAIAQEALSNIVRHSKARHVTVRARCEEDQLNLVIEDDGVGITSQTEEGHGLRNMRDRASLLHGDLQVRRLKKGTSVSLTAPWKVEP